VKNDSKTSKGGVPLPPGAHSAAIPCSRANAALKGAVRPKPVTIDNSFVASPKGGAALVAGKRHIEIKDNRTRTSR
jgi:hypothetical protein